MRELGLNMVYENKQLSGFSSPAVAGNSEPDLRGYSHTTQPVTRFSAREKGKKLMFYMRNEANLHGRPFLEFVAQNVYRVAKSGG